MDSQWTEAQVAIMKRAGDLVEAGESPAGLTAVCVFALRGDEVAIALLTRGNVSPEEAGPYVTKVGERLWPSGSDVSIIAGLLAGLTRH